MSTTSTPHSPTTLISTFLSLTESHIIPLTRSRVSEGCKLFGAAILSRATLAPITIESNNERLSPLLHGEINCIQAFFASPKEGRPATKDCIFFATHEPCSLCLSGITWSGFNEFYYLFTYEDSRDLFDIPFPSESDTPATLAAKPLYNRTNKFFTSRSITDLVASLPDAAERTKWTAEAQRVKALYNQLSDTYQKGKVGGTETSSVFL